MDSYYHEGFIITKFQRNLRGSCRKVVEMIWNDPAASSEREPVTTTAILLTCFSQLDFSTAARAHLIEGE